jgi:hypothetical protein
MSSCGLAGMERLAYVRIGPEPAKWKGMEAGESGEVGEGVLGRGGGSRSAGIEGLT